MKRRPDTPLPDEWFECANCEKLKTEIRALKKQLRQRAGVYETADEYRDRTRGDK